MSINNDTTKLLGIKDPNIKIIEGSLIECKVKNENKFILQGVLSYRPDKCSIAIIKQIMKSILSLKG